MTNALGQGAFFGVGETTGGAWGDIAARTEFFEMESDSDGLHSEPEFIENDSLFVATRPANVGLGQDKAQGTLTFKMRFGGWMRLLSWAMAHKPAPSGAGPYTWVFEPQADMSANVGSGLTFEVFRGSVGAGGGGANESFLYSGAVIRGMELSIDENAAVSCAVDIMAQRVTRAAKTASPTFDASARVLFPSPNATPTAFFAYDPAGDDLQPRVKSARLFWRRPLEEDAYRVESRLMDKPNHSDFWELGASVDTIFDDWQQWDDFQAAAMKDSLFTIDGVSAAAEQMVFRYRSCTVKGEPEVDSHGPVPVTLELMAHEPAGNLAMTATIINADDASHIA